MSLVDEGALGAVSELALSPDEVTTGEAAAVFVDLDAALLLEHQGRRGIELGAQADIEQGIDRLSQIFEKIVVLAYPNRPEQTRLGDGVRVDTLRETLGRTMDQLIVIACPHESGTACDCAKPGSGLIEMAVEEHGLAPRDGWFIGADQEGVQSGRGAGLRTVRIGPTAHDHMSAVHRPDYEARDLLDAANHILVEELD